MDEKDDATRVTEWQLAMDDDDPAAAAHEQQLIWTLVRRRWDRVCGKTALSRKTNYRRLIFALVALALAAHVLFGGYTRKSTFAGVPAPPPRLASYGAARHNPYAIQVPPRLDPLRSKTLWNDLRLAFESCPPTPTHIDQPHNLGGPPGEVGPQVDGFDLSEADAADSRRAHEQFVAKLADFHLPAHRFSGRGVVMLAGSSYSEYALTSLGVLRELGSRLPVEVWQKDRSEELVNWCEEMEGEGMTCRFLDDHMDVDAIKHNYALKLYAMVFSSFADILFLDADSMPIRNPDFLFDSDPYTHHGAILWPDYWIHSGSPNAPYITGINTTTSNHIQRERSVESGQIMWNKQKHWRSLLLAGYYNYWGPDFYWTIFNNGHAGWGDKDTFPMALKAMREHYHMVPWPVHTIFTNVKPGAELHGVAMLQADPTNSTAFSPMFLHANIIKFSIFRYLCEDCVVVPGDPSVKSYYGDPNHELYERLRAGERTLSTIGLAEHGLDPEPIIWRAFEHTACHGVLRCEELCDKTRTYVGKAFPPNAARASLAMAGAAWDD